MKIVIPGGSGHLGRILCSALRRRGHEVVVLSRRPASVGGARVVGWDGRSLGAWADEIDGADVVINLAGRSVNCRYTRANLREMIDSRVLSTRVVGRAIERASTPPRAWLQMSTATIYAHRFDAPNDEATGIIGGEEADVPDYWRFSIEIATGWERAQLDARTPRTRKVVLRTAMVMDPAGGGTFDLLLRLTRLGLGGAIAGGLQYMSWIHDADFTRSVEFLIEEERLDGPVNLAAPVPLPQREFMAALRAAWSAPIGLPASGWMVELGAAVLGTDAELILKSRRVVPGRLQEAGYSFQHPEWPPAARELVARWRAEREPARAQGAAA
jgi:uncharacterized protein (TIGR01777 family)